MQSPPRILFIGRASAKESRPLVEALAKRWELHAVVSGKDGQEQAAALVPRLVIVDAASLRTTGERVCKGLRAVVPAAAIVRLLGAQAALGVSACADLTLHHPLTARKLLLHLQKLLDPPTENILAVGGVQLHLERRLLSANGHSTQLNPKLATLFAVLLSQPNQTIDRAELMRAVWDTDYTQDTRTLNVHISHARQILVAHGSPALIETVRGIGYRLLTDPS
ncbi:MAG: response regulator transcription factor [Anaerolineae bacterium]|jgi:DNA-binding response OmpR family regulator|nr:response regulator transcription factor [Anaerolineae bacterium]